MPVQPYRLTLGIRAQNAKDYPGDTSLELNHISPETNAENCGQNEQPRRSGATGDICS